MISEVVWNLFHEMVQWVTLYSAETKDKTLRPNLNLSGYNQV